MKRVILLLVLSVCALSGQEYNSIDFYGQTVYTMLNDYTTTNTTLGLDDVTNYLYGQQVEKVLYQAADEGYSSHAVIKSTYTIGTQQAQINDIVMQVLLNEMTNYNYQKTIYINMVCIGTCFSSAISVISVGYYITRIVPAARRYAQGKPIFGDGTYPD